MVLCKFEASGKLFIYLRHEQCKKRSYNELKAKIVLFFIIPQSRQRNKTTFNILQGGVKYFNERSD